MLTATGRGVVRVSAVLECRFVMLTATSEPRMMRGSVVLNSRFVMLTAVFRCSMFLYSVLQWGCRFVMLTATGRFATDRFVMLTIVLECRFVMLTAVGRFVMLTAVLFQCSVFRCSVLQELHFVLVIVVIGL